MQEAKDGQRNLMNVVSADIPDQRVFQMKSKKRSGSNTLQQSPKAQLPLPKVSRPNLFESKKELDIQLGQNRNATSHSFLVDNTKMAKSPSFITTQENGLQRKDIHQQSQRRNHSLDGPMNESFARHSPNGGHRSQILVCKNQLSASRSNHLQIKEQIICQNNRNKSLPSMAVGVGTFAEANSSI